MADGIFNIAKGKVGYYATLPAANDALILLLLKTTVADGTLVDFDDFAAMLAGGCTESNATNYARKTITASVTSVADDTNDRLDADFPDQTFTALGGATNNSLLKAIVGYDNDTTSGNDSNIIPLTHHDFTVTTDGTDVVVQVAAAGFYRAQ